MCSVGIQIRGELKLLASSSSSVEIGDMNSVNNHECFLSEFNESVAELSDVLSVKQVAHAHTTPQDSMSLGRE